MPANHCIPHTKEAKRKMSLARLGVPNLLNRQKTRYINGVEYFVCSKCHQYLPKSSFYKERRPRYTNGITSQCKKCHAETSKRTGNPATRRLANVKAEAQRRAIKAGSYIERISFEAIKKRDKMICGLCHKKVKEEELSFDHTIPLSRGGSHTENNLQVAHKSCNFRKYTGRIPSQIRLNIPYSFRKEESKMQLIVVINNMDCPICESQQPHVYQDKEEQLVCLGCRKQGRETVTKLTNPGVVIGKYIQN